MPIPSSGAPLSQVEVRNSRIVGVLVAIALALAAASLAVDLFMVYTGHDRLMGLRPLFDLDLEGNIPTFFSAVMLLFAGLLSAVHELRNGPMKGVLGNPSGAFRFARVVPAMALTAILGLFLRCFLRLPAATRFRIGLAAVVYVGGALGMEMVGAILFISATLDDLTTRADDGRWHLVGRGSMA